MRKTKYKKREPKFKDNWPIIRKRLEKEISLYESFKFSVKEKTLDDCFGALEYLKQHGAPPHFRTITCNWVYQTLFSKFPIIKLKVSQEQFESWIIIHSIEQLKEAIGYKND